MPRVVGIDPGTVSIDVCGMSEGEVYLDRSWPTEQALADPEDFIQFLTRSGLPDLVAGPSGYGLPLIPAAQATDDDLRLAFLAPPGESGGIGGLRGFARRLAAADLAVVYTPGVIHLDTVPTHRKINRVDLGTADKLCATLLGIYDQCERRNRRAEDVSFVLIELGGAFTAGLAVERGQVTDGVGGTSGPIGWQAAGALDGEVAFLAGQISKGSLFQGGVASLLEQDPNSRTVALDAYVEGALKAVRQLQGSARSADEVLVSGRRSAEPEIFARLSTALADIGEVRLLTGFARHAKQGAQGAALMADGLTGGRHARLVDRMRLRHARGTVLDHLAFITPATAKQRLGISIGD
jgi:predicted butyrate kinase (DUF1464 family)